MSKYKIEKLPTNIHGLKYFPRLLDWDMDADGPPARLLGHKCVGPIGFKDLDCRVLKEEVVRLGDKLKVALEIGMTAPHLHGSTFSILENRPQGSLYLGVDKAPYTWLAELGFTDAHCLCSDSTDRDAVMKFIRSFTDRPIDLLMIDGWHSVNVMVNDWAYSELLSDHGVVVIHDVSVHPGPCVVFDAIDDDIYDKFIYDGNEYWGIAVARKKITG